MKITNQDPIIWCVIPTHGAGEAFIRCVSSLLTQSLKPAGILIVDNNSKDGAVQKLNDINFGTINLKIVKLKENGGVSKGRNEGILNLPEQYDYVCFIDHDMQSDKDLLKELFGLATKEENSGIITPKIFYFENKKIIWSAGTGIDIRTGRTVFYGGEDKGQFNTNRKVEVAPAILFVKKLVIDKIKKFDEIYFATYEDTDFCFRAKYEGFETWCAAKAIAYHEIPYDKDLANLRLLERSYWVGRNRYIFLRKFNLINKLTAIFAIVYLIYYSWLAIKYNKLNAIFQYIKGMVNGFRVPLK